MHIIAVSHWPGRRAELPEEWEIWETPYPIPISYAYLAHQAVDEGWGLDTVVVQDDVRFTEDPLPESSASLVVYGQGDAKHVCPRAFAATPDIWEQLAGVWKGGPVCLTWRPVVRKHGAVLNVTRHLDLPRE